MRRLIFFLAIVILLNLSMISAEIMFSQPKSVYSIGDFLDFSISTANGPGELIVNLVCENNAKQIRQEYLTEDKNNIRLVYPLTYENNLLPEDFKGNCHVEANLGAKSSSSQIFQITDKIDLSFTTSPMVVKPGEKISLKGTAVKANMENLDGFVEISVDRTSIYIIRPVNQGKFEANFSMADNAKSGNYNILVRAYDKSGNENGNQDSRSSGILLKQEPRKLGIILDYQNVNPIDKIKIKSAVYDQAGDEIQGDVKIEVKDNQEEIYFTKIIRTDEEIQLGFPEDASPGYWTIYASSLGLSSDRYIYMQEYEKARFDVVNNTLLVTNIGNIDYKHSIQIKIGASMESKDIKLKVGESRKFRLLAPDGSYDVSITDGSEETRFSSIPLTGNAVSIEDIQNQMNLFSRYPIVWLFLIILAGLFVVMLAGKMNKRKFYGAGVNTEREVKEESKEDKSRKFSEIKTEGFTLVKEAKSAEHSLVMNGKKEEAAILNLKIKNSGIIKNKNAKESIDKAAEMINRNKGSLYQSGDNIIGIFTPSLTKSFRNDLTAVKVASEIASYLNEHNRKFKERIDFGLGIHSGEIAAKIENEKLKFTALGNTINLAKRIAEKAENNVLLSKDSNNKVSNEVKTDRAGDYYSIKRIIDREQHKAFIDSFLKRN